eukprot:55354-Pleurochrysis_carterae.AAC.1
MNSHFRAGRSSPSLVFVLLKLSRARLWPLTNCGCVSSCASCQAGERPLRLAALELALLVRLWALLLPRGER